MRTQNAVAMVKLAKAGRHLKICLYANPGPFPFGAPRTMGTAQYLGIGQHLCLTLIEDKNLAGLLAFQADLPMTPAGDSIHWAGGVSCQPWQGDIWYHIHPLFVRDVDQLMPGVKDLHLAATISGINGVISNRQYWLVEIPSLTREVLLNLDEIVVVRRRVQWQPFSAMQSKVSRGEFWQTGGFVEHPVYEERRKI